MTANYKLVKNLTARKSDGKVLYHARFAPEMTVRSGELIDQVRERTALSPADLKAALQVLQDLIVESLNNGRNVELEGIGTFSAVLTHRPLEDKKVRAESIRFRDVHFRSSGKLRERLRTMSLRRVDEETPSGLTDTENVDATKLRSICAGWLKKGSCAANVLAGCGCIPSDFSIHLQR